MFVGWVFSCCFFFSSSFFAFNECGRNALSPTCLRGRGRAAILLLPHVQLSPSRVLPSPAGRCGHFRTVQSGPSHLLYTLRNDALRSCLPAPERPTTTKKNRGQQKNAFLLFLFLLECQIRPGLLACGFTLISM